MLGFVTTKKRISIILLVFLLILLIVLTVIYKASEANALKSQLPSAGSTVERIAFIENMGYKVNGDESEKSKEIEIPNIFNEVYEKYQQVQLKAGYDLKKFAGCKATLYTYNLIVDERTDVYAHLLVSQGVIIGGDISALSVTDGYIKPLAP